MTGGPTRHRAPRHLLVLGALALGVGLSCVLALVAALGGQVTGTVPGPAADPRRVLRCTETVAGSGPPPLVTSNQLYACPRDYDGDTVRYRGEVVGPVLHRAGGAWAQLNDDVYAGPLGMTWAKPDWRGGNAGVGVLLPPGLAALVRHVGGPASHGDVLQVVGTFRRVDPATAEVAVVLVRTGSVLHRGRDTAVPVQPVRVAVAAGLTLLAAAAWVVERIHARRR